MTPRTLHIAKGLSLPLDAVTQTFAIFGKRGSGKTNGATVLVEELLRAHLPVVVLDPVDAWWGLKSSFDEVQGSAVLPTDAGRAALDGSFEPLPSGADLLAYWFARLPEGERKVLELLARHEGQDVDRERISDTTGYKRSARDSYLSRLKARGLVEFTGPGLVRASQELF